MAARKRTCRFSHHTTRTPPACLMDLRGRGASGSNDCPLFTQFLAQFGDREVARAAALLDTHRGRGAARLATAMMWA